MVDLAEVLHVESRRVLDELDAMMQGVTHYTTRCVRTESCLPLTFAVTMVTENNIIQLSCQLL